MEITLSLLEVGEINRYLEGSLKVSESAPSHFSAATKPLSGKDLVLRLAGLLSPGEADAMERHINESCEQLDD